MQKELQDARLESIRSREAKQKKLIEQEKLEAESVSQITFLIIIIIEKKEKNESDSQRH